MKRVNILIVLLFICDIGVSQIKYINSLDGSYNMIEIEDEGLKYFKIHRNTNTVIIYNLNNTLYKKIRLEVPVHQMLEQIKSISKYQFNKDDLIEVAYTTYYEITDNTNSLGYDEVGPYMYTLIICNESGDKLLSISGANYYKLMHNGQQKILVVTKQKKEGHFAETSTELYSLQK